MQLIAMEMETYSYGDIATQHLFFIEAKKWKFDAAYHLEILIKSIHISLHDYTLCQIGYHMKVIRSKTGSYKNV